MPEVWSLGPTACSELVSLPKGFHSHFIDSYKAVYPAPWTQQHISQSCPPHWALIVYCKAIESLPVNTNPKGSLIARASGTHRAWSLLFTPQEHHLCPEAGLNQKHVDLALHGPNMKSRWDKCWPGKHPPPGYPLMLSAAHFSCTRLTQRRGCKERCPHLSLPGSASCVRPKRSQKERETMFLPQNLQHMPMQIASQNLGLFLFLLLMKIDRPVAPL